MGHPLTPSHCTRTRTTLPGKLLKTNITLLGCFGFFTMFLAQWLNWYNFSVYESRFSANDAAHRVGLRPSWISWLSWGGVIPTAKHGVPGLPAGVQVAAVSGSAMCRHACWRLAVDEQVQAWLCHWLPCGETGHHAAVSGSHRPGRGVGVEASLPLTPTLISLCQILRDPQVCLPAAPASTGAYSSTITSTVCVVVSTLYTL